MKMLLFSDIHADTRALESLMNVEADAYFCAGDLVNWGRGLETVGDIMKRRAGKVYVIPGNHESESDIRLFCARFGFHAMHGRMMEFDGVRVAALGYSNPTPFDTPGEYSEAELERRLAEFQGYGPQVLICHCPPKDTPLDGTPKGLHFGSSAVADFIKQNQPQMFFCGHVHECAGVEARLGETIGRNLGKDGFLLDFANIKS